VKQGIVDPTNIRDYNLSQVLRLIHERGSLSRASIVRSTYLSATSVSSIVSELISSGFVKEVGEGKSSGGRRPILLQFNPDACFAIGVDMGASHITAVITNLSGKVKAIRSQKFGTAEDPQGAIQLLMQMIVELIDASARSMADFLGIGLTVPAPLEGEHLDRLSPVILPNWKDISLTDELTSRFHLPVYIDNDANGGAIAEKWWGSGRGVSNLVYIKLGVGVGSGLIINNEVFRGSGGTAGEIGHTAIDPNGPPCRCGNLGCMESYVGVPAVVETTKTRLKEFTNSELHDTEVTIDTIIAAAQNRDPLAVEVVRAAGQYLGISVANLLNLVNPELVVLGGDLVETGEIFLDAVKASAFNRSISKVADETTIITSQLRENVIAVGAATLVIYNAFLPINIRRTLSMDVRR
jgi:glucokinase-like ROK family protein